MQSSIRFNHESLPMSTLLNIIKSFESGIGNSRLDLSPEYQRGAVWNPEFKDKLIYSIIKRYPVGSLIIRNLEVRKQNGANMEIVDGQQRLRAVKGFIEEDFSLSEETTALIIKEHKEYFEFDVGRKGKLGSKAVKLYEKFLAGKKVQLTYETMPEPMRNDWDSYNFSVTYVSHQDDDEIAKYFRYVQNQERLRAGEIINAIPHSELEHFLNQINVGNILGVFNWADKRKEFEKLFFGAIGIFAEKINLGCIDRQVIEFVSSCGTLKDKALGQTNKMIANLNHISQQSKVEVNIAANKRYIKFIFLLSGFGMIDFTLDTVAKLQSLFAINKRLSVFSSAIENAVEDEFVSESAETINKYRSIALISKGSHAYQRVFDRMKILAELITNYGKTI